MPIPGTSLAARFRPIIILFALFSVAWVDMFFPVTSIAAFSTKWFAASALKNGLRVALILFVMSRWGGLGCFSLGTTRFFPRASDIASSLLVASGAGLMALALAGISLAAGLRNPLDFSAAGQGFDMWHILWMGLASLGIGYAEELFFRYFTPNALARAGFPPFAAMVSAILFFGLSHGSQGAIGMVQAALLALVFFFFRSRGKSLHALALGHAIYDFILLVALA